VVISDVRDYWLEAKRLLHDGFYASCGIICEYLFGCGVRSYEIDYMHAVSRYSQGNYTGAYEKVVPHVPREARARWLAEKCLKAIS